MQYSLKGYGCVICVVCTLKGVFFLFFFYTSMSQLMQHHGCRSHLRDRNKLTGLDDRFDLVVDANDLILEKVVGYL